MVNIMNKGIGVAGNIILDKMYMIEGYPKISELSTITDIESYSIGGVVCNNLIDIHKLDNNIPLYAFGMIGKDEEGSYILQQLKKYNINIENIIQKGKTSTSYVMNDTITNQRTFFHYRGANSLFDETHINLNDLNLNIFHIGYILLLDKFDELDDQYGTKLAKILYKIQQKGILTSVDVVSEASDRYAKIVSPALKYTNYCIINEIEAQGISGIKLFDNHKLYKENFPKALQILAKMGVNTWIVIHTTQFSIGYDCVLKKYVEIPSLKLPNNYIKGSTGAGDAYCSGILLGAYKKYSLKKSMQIATATAAMSLSYLSATDGIKNLSETWKFYNEQIYK